MKNCVIKFFNWSIKKSTCKEDLGCILNILRGTLVKYPSEHSLKSSTLISISFSPSLNSSFTFLIKNHSTITILVIHKCSAMIKEEISQLWFSYLSCFLLFGNVCHFQNLKLHSEFYTYSTGSLNNPFNLSSIFSLFKMKIQKKNENGKYAHSVL